MTGASAGTAATGAMGPGMGPGPGVGVVTIVAGRRGHLANQLEGLTRQHQPPEQVVIVRMDGDPVRLPEDLRERTTIVDMAGQTSGARPGSLPLAAARNAGVRALQTPVVVLLDVDCIPGAGLVGGYARAAQHTDGLICGALRYLPAGRPRPGSVDWQEPELLQASEPHPARPAGAAGIPMRDDRHELAWTTSLAMRAETFGRIGGFDERFHGYGGEDTDFAFRSRAAGFGVWWTSDAVAFHQHHESQSPPVQHLHDIVRNAELFAQLHGWYPMQGWLEEFTRMGLIDFTPADGLLRLRAGR